MRRRICIMLLTLVFVASVTPAVAAPRWTYTVSAVGEFSLNPWSFVATGVAGDATWAGRGLLTMREAQSGDLLYVARVACLYVNESDGVAIAGGPVLWQSDLFAPENDGRFWIMKDSPGGDMFRPGETGGVTDWPSFCSDEFFYPAFVAALVPVASGDIAVSAFTPGRP